MSDEVCYRIWPNNDGWEIDIGSSVWFPNKEDAIAAIQAHVLRVVASIGDQRVVIGTHRGAEDPTRVVATVSDPPWHEDPEIERMAYDFVEASRAVHREPRPWSAEDERQARSDLVTTDLAQRKVYLCRCPKVSPNSSETTRDPSCPVHGDDGIIEQDRRRTVMESPEFAAMTAERDEARAKAERWCRAFGVSRVEHERLTGELRNACEERDAMIRRLDALCGMCGPSCATEIRDLMNENAALKAKLDEAGERGRSHAPHQPQAGHAMGMGIGQAINEMRQGRRVARKGWNGKGMWLALQIPDAHSKMTEPYVYMRTAQGGLIPWLCSQADLLATDWDIVD